MSQSYNIVILGSGPAGLAAALFAAQAGLEPLVITGPTFGGNLSKARLIKNWLGANERPGVELVTLCKEQLEKAGVHFLADQATSLSLMNDEKKISLASGVKVSARAVVVTCGSGPATLECAGIEEHAEGFVFNKLENPAMYAEKEIAIIGGGDIAVTYASELLNAGASKVIIIQPYTHITAKARLFSPIKDDPRLSIVYRHTISNVFLKENRKTITISPVPEAGIDISERKLQPAAVLVALGSRPNTSLLKGQLPLDSAGYIKLLPGTQCTLVAGVFAAGDAADPRYRHAFSSAGQGFAAAFDAKLYLEGRLAQAPSSHKKPE